MPLGLFMLLIAVVLVGGMWLYNAWPEWQLRRIAHHLDVPASDLQTTGLVVTSSIDPRLPTNHGCRSGLQQR